MDTIASATTLVPVGVAPAVSIVVPCYNGGRFLDGLMASLARQTFRDFDVVIVDDGSTDELTLCKLAALRDAAPDALRDQVRVIHQANRGASAARNTGAREARADLLFMLDCDDTVEPNFLAEVVPALRAAPPDVGVAVAHMRLIGAETGVARRYFNRFDLLFTNTLSPGIVVRKASWRAAGGYDETMRDGYEDWDFSLRLAEAGYRAIEIAKPLYIYHVAGDEARHSLSSGVHSRRLYAELWRQIRSRHAQSYGPIAIARLWWSRRHDRGGRVALWKGLAGYLAALTLPDTVFNRLFATLQRRRMHAHT